MSHAVTRTFACAVLIALGSSSAFAQSGSTSGAVVVSSGKVIGEGVSGTVSPSGSVSTQGQGQGVTFTSTGRVSGRSGSGTWRRSDGCGGTWTSAKQ